jgi:hypothetical protein
MKYMKYLILLFGVVITILITSCGSTTEGQITAIKTEASTPTTLSHPTHQSTPTLTTLDTPTNNVDIYYGLTYQSPDGNRVIAGQANLPSHKPVEITLPGMPLWVVGAPYQDGSLWTVALQDGEVISLFASKGSIVEQPNNFSALTPGTPIHIRSSDDNYALVKVPDINQSTLTHPVYLPRTDARAYITQSGDVIIVDSSDHVLATLPVNALPDARIILDGQDRLLILSDPTDDYRHAVLGDPLEAKSITLINTQPTIEISSKILLEGNEVIEGIAPIWVDLTGDQQREIVVTVSDINLGAGIVILNENGQRLAEGPKMGQAYRWRHQIAIGAFGPNGEKELAVVRTPHIGGVVEYYQFSNEGLSIVADFPGITSHTIGSRNLDMAAAGDFDGDGALELLLPSPDLTELVAVRRSTSGAEQVWQLPIDGQMSTNLAGVTLSNGTIAIAVGRTDGVLRLWLSE